MYEWSRVIFAKKSKFHDAGGPDTMVLPFKFYFLKGIIQFQRSAHLPNGYFRLLNVFSLKLLLLLHWIVLYHE